MKNDHWVNYFLKKIIFFSKFKFKEFFFPLQKGDICKGLYCDEIAKLWLLNNNM